MTGTPGPASGLLHRGKLVLAFPGLLKAISARMTDAKIKQRPLQLYGSRKSGVRTQFGALVWRREAGEIRILLIGGRRSRRWGIPKGWPQSGATPARAATREAWEEAGAVGKAAKTCIGVYSYLKKIDGRPPLPCVVAVFPMEAQSLSDTWPESGQRRRKWFRPEVAARKIRNPELRSIVLGFVSAAAAPQNTGTESPPNVAS